MARVDLEVLLAALSRPAFVPTPSSRLQVAPEPKPFVPPKLLVPTEALAGRGAFSTEVIIVDAPAAVGKSTVARYLSSRSGVPILNLAETPVSTHSLVGLLQADFVGSNDPIAAFHAGRLPMIIDALDEGRLLTGERGFEGFLETAAELLLRQREVTDRPKLVLFGRTGSSTDAALILSLLGDRLATQVAIDFFDEGEARAVVESYADRADAFRAPFRENEPAQRVIGAYFDAIGRALTLKPADLWSDPAARSFSGYAPVLATLGEALAHERNFQQLENRLGKTGSSHAAAWGVIEDVMDRMLSREGDQFRQKLEARIGASVPVAIYDKTEQLGYLTRWLHGLDLVGAASPKLQLNGDALKHYHSLVEQRLPEHPFVVADDRRPRNAVFAAAVVAHAIANGLGLGSKTDLCDESARQPFLWRCFQADAHDRATLIEGSMLGYILSSLWNDPGEAHPRVIMDSPEGGGGAVNVEVRGVHDTDLEVIPPAHFHGSAQDVDLRGAGPVHLVGATARRGRSVFSFKGKTSISCTDLYVDADEIVIEGEVWLSADVPWHSNRLGLHIKPDARYGWGGSLRTRYPWSNYKSTLELPEAGEEELLARLVRAFIRHVGSSSRPFYISTSYGAPDKEYGERSTWMTRDFAREFPIFMRGLLDAGLASSDIGSAGGSQRFRVSVKFAWPDLLAAVKTPESAPRDLVTFANGIRLKLQA